MSLSTAQLLAILGLEVMLLAALCARPRGAVFAVLVAGAGLALPAFVAAPSLARAFFGIAFFMCFVRALDIARRPSPRPFLARLMHLALIVDPSDRRTWRRGSLLPSASTAAAWLAVLTLAVFVVSHPTASALPRPLLWVTAAIGALALFEGTHALLAFGGACLGSAAPPISLQPYRSTTLAEFWGRRWNPVISGVLREHCFQPLARSPSTAMAAAFVASGALHAYLGLVSLDVSMSASLGAFFVAQVPFFLAERRLRVRRWPSAAARAWTFGTLLLLLPLVAEPFLRLLDSGASPTTP